MYYKISKARSPEAEAAALKLNKSNLARARIYSLLGITAEEVAVAPQITPELREIAQTLKREGQPRVIHKLIGNPATGNITDISVEHVDPPAGADIHLTWPEHLATDDHADAKKVLIAYHSVPSGRKLLSIEAYCVAAKVSPLSILGILVGSIVRRGASGRTIIAMMNQPRVVQKSVEMALTDDGIADRELLAKATGFLPTPKGAQTIVNVAANANAAATAQSASAPPPEHTVRTLVDLFNEARGLPPASARILPIAEVDTLPEQMPYEDDERVPVDADDASDDPDDVRTI
jgi:hypothetical protein